MEVPKDAQVWPLSISVNVSSAPICGPSVDLACSMEIENHAPGLTGAYVHCLYLRGRFPLTCLLHKTALSTFVGTLSIF